jgi:hypothetical protein
VTDVTDSSGSYLTPSFDHARVADAMRPRVLTCDPETPLVSVAQRMASEHVHAIPLVALMLATPARFHPRMLALTVPHIAGGRTAREPTVLAEQAAARLHRPPDPLGYVYQLYAAARWSGLPWLHRAPHPALIVAARRIPASRYATPACSPRACPTPGCTS